MSDKQATDGVSGSVDGSQRLKRIATRLRSGQAVEPVTVRELLSWFGVQRRGYIIVFMIAEELSEAGLTTEPYFEHAYIDGLIEFHLSEKLEKRPEEKPAEGEVVAFPGGEATSADALVAPPAFSIDPTYRIGRLRSANITPTSVAPNHTITEAITIMLASDFSQLPVMVGERDVKGVISWSSIGRNLALGRPCIEARECMDPPRVIDSDTSLFSAITEIVDNQYVLVRDGTNKVCGIVTTSDLSLQFQQLTEPFLLLGEIENHIRSLIHKGAFSQDQLRNCCDPNDGERAVSGIFDLNFGEYIRLLENKDCWTQLKLKIDRTIFIASLDRVRKIRNDVMHFDPDGITDDDLDALRKFAGFLQKLQPMLNPQPAL